MQVTVIITLKAEVLDAPGTAIAQGLRVMGFRKVTDVRQGRVIHLTLDETDQEQARKSVKEMCERLLANPLIEDYTISF